MNDHDAELDELYRLRELKAKQNQTILTLEATVAVMRTISLTDISDLVIENQNQLICSQAHRTDEAEMHLFRFQKLFKKIGNALSQSAPTEMLDKIYKAREEVSEARKYLHDERVCIQFLNEALQLLPERKETK